MPEESASAERRRAMAPTITLDVPSGTVRPRHTQGFAALLLAFERDAAKAIHVQVLSNRTAATTRSTER